MLNHSWRWSLSCLSPPCFFRPKIS